MVHSLRSALLVCAVAMVAVQSPAWALDGKALASRQCASCHSLTGPAPRTIAGVLERKAPDLFYAGSKFQRSWLVAWIQRPAPIRAAGTMFLQHVVSQAGKDRIAQGSVKPCASRLTPAEADAVADYLMTLKDTAMKTGLIDPSRAAQDAKAYRLFTKQLPCIGCHTIEFRKRSMGGVSAPDLRGAGSRLNPDWIYARIENPQYWDPRTWMPRIEMSHEKREALALFIASQR